MSAPASGVVIESTSDLPSQATQADVSVTPLTDAQFFSNLSAALGTPYFNFAERVLACVVLTEKVVRNPNAFAGYTIPQDKTLQALFLAACLQTAVEVSAPQGPHVRTASAGCFSRQQFMTVRYRRSGSGYTAQVGPTSRRPKLHSAIQITCRRTAKGLQLRVKARRRGQRLRSAVGRMLTLGVGNPSSHPIKLRISFTVK